MWGWPAKRIQDTDRRCVCWVRLMLRYKKTTLCASGTKIGWQEVFLESPRSTLSLLAEVQMSLVVIDKNSTKKATVDYSDNLSYRKSETEQDQTQQMNSVCRNCKNVLFRAKEHLKLGRKPVWVFDALEVFWDTTYFRTSFPAWARLKPPMKNAPEWARTKNSPIFSREPTLLCRFSFFTCSISAFLGNKPYWILHLLRLPVSNKNVNRGGRTLHRTKLLTTWIHFIYKVSMLFSIGSWEGEPSHDMQELLPANSAREQRNHVRSDLGRQREFLRGSTEGHAFATSGNCTSEAFFSRTDRYVVDTVWEQDRIKTSNVRVFGRENWHGVSVTTAEISYNKHKFRVWASRNGLQ